MLRGQHLVRTPRVSGGHLALQTADFCRLGPCPDGQRLRKGVAGRWPLRGPVLRKEQASGKTTPAPRGIVKRPRRAHKRRARAWGRGDARREKSAAGRAGEGQRRLRGGRGGACGKAAREGAVIGAQGRSSRAPDPRLSADKQVSETAARRPAGPSARTVRGGGAALPCAAFGRQCGCGAASGCPCAVIRRRRGSGACEKGPCGLRRDLRSGPPCFLCEFIAL